MLIALLYDVMVDDFDTFFNSNSTIWRLYVSKFIINIVLHLSLTPYFVSSLDLMKFVTNHPKQFDQAPIVFFIGFVYFLIALLFEMINTVILVSELSI